MYDPYDRSQGFENGKQYERERTSSIFEAKILELESMSEKASECGMSQIDFCILQLALIENVLMIDV